VRCLLLPFVALSLLFPAACGSSGGDGGIEIRFLPWQEDYDFIGPLIDRFERGHPGIRVKILRAADQNETLKTLCASGSPPDVFAIDVEMFPAYLSAGVLAPLDGKLEESGFDPEEYFPVTLEAFRAPDPKGVVRQFALPKDCTPYVLYYNRDLFREAGLDPPGPDWTWEDLFSAAKKLTGPPNALGSRERFGLSMNWWVQALMPWIWSAGGDILDGNGRCVFDSPEVLRAVRFLKRLVDAGVTPRQVHREASFGSRVSFAEGRIAMIAPAGRWVVDRVRNRGAKIRFDVALLPKGPEGRRPTALAETGYCLSSASSHPEEAFALLAFLAGEEGARLMASRGIAVPAMKKVAAGKAFLDPKRDPVHDEVFLRALEEARLVSTFPRWEEVKNFVREALEACLVTGRLEPEEALAEGARRIRALLERDSRRKALPRFPLAAALWVFLGLLAGALVLFLRAQRGGPPAERRERRAAAFFLAPWFLGFSIFVFGPVYLTLCLSFADWSALEPLDEARFAGLGNFIRLFGEDPLFFQAVKVTGLYVLLSVPLQLGLALGLAMLLDRPLPFRGVFRTLIYLPSLVSGVAMTVLWGWIFDRNGGLLNRGLALFGLSGPDWLGNTDTVLTSFVLMSLWFVGGTVVVFLAGLKTIPSSLHDAARIDGAGAFHRFRHVTLPMLSPVILFNLITLVIGSFQVFTQSYVLTDGGPDNASLFYVLYVYRQAFRFHDMGYAAALAWILFMVVLLMTLAILKASRPFLHSSEMRA